MSVGSRCTKSDTQYHGHMLQKTRHGIQGKIGSTAIQCNQSYSPFLTSGSIL